MFELKRVELYISVSPRYATNIPKGVHIYLSKLIMRYIPSLSGVLVAYTNVTLPPTAALLTDNPDLYLTITVDFTLFTPQPDELLLGHVNKTSSGHVGLLVHGLFNASIAADEIGMLWQGDEQAWGEVVNGSWVRFRVERLAVDDATLTLVGSMKGAQLGAVSIS